MQVGDPPDDVPVELPDEVPLLNDVQELDVAQFTIFFFFPVNVFVTPLTVQLKVSCFPDDATQLKLAFGLADWALAKVLHCGLGSPAGCTGNPPLVLLLLFVEPGFEHARAPFNLQFLPIDRLVAKNDIIFRLAFGTLCSGVLGT